MNLIKSFSDLISRKTHTVIFPTWDSEDAERFGRKSMSDFLGYNQLSLYVNRAIDKRAEKVSEIEFVLKKGEDTVERHPFLDLLNRPNKFHTGKQFWKLYQKYLDVTGQAFIWVGKERELFSKRPASELHLLRPDRMTILFNADKSEITGYEYKRMNGDATRFEPDEVIYSFNPDPLNPLHGESILRSGVRAIEAELDLSEYHANVLKNGGRIEGVFAFKSQLTATQMDELKESYNEKYAEAKRSGRPLFLGGDAKYEKVGLNPEELSYLESKKVTLGDICLMTGVPRSILSQTSDETFANADASIAIFLRETIKPLLVNLTDILDWRLIPEDLDLTFVDPTPEDVDQKIKIINAAHATNSVTINEKREMLGLDPYEAEEADDIYIPFSVVPLEKERNTPSETPTQDPPVGEGSEKTAKTKADFDHPLRDPYIRKKYGEVMDKRLASREKLMEATMKRYFEAQETRLIEAIGGKKHFRKKDFIDETFDRDLELRLAKGAVLPLLEQFLKEAGGEAMDLLGSSGSFILSSEIGNWLDGRSNLFAEEITRTTFETLKQEFSDSFEAGETRQQLVDRIQNTYEGFDEVRSITIARTEVHGAVQKGTFEGYRQAGSPIKIWVSVGDSAVRASHAIADGEEVMIDQTFSNGLLYPGDPAGPPEETINCRCTV